MEYILKTNNIFKCYQKKFNALNGLSMCIPKGSIYGLVGKNGAGKTTLIRIICGLQMPTSGDLELYGKSTKSEEICNERKKVGAVVETPSIYLDMTAEDNLKLQYRLLGIKDFKEIKDILELVGLAKTGSKKAKNFSLGMRQRLGIAIALCGDPEFLVLDEPINGLDPQGIIDIRELILKLNREKNITVLISSHVLDELARLATHYGFVDGGRMVREMSAEEFTNACKKSVRVKVTDIQVLVAFLEKKGIAYNIIDENTLDMYDNPNFTEFAVELLNEGCSVISMLENDESLESFFLSLIGGKS